MRCFALIPLCLLASACVSFDEEPAPTPGAMQAMRLAEALNAAARENPALVERTRPEMTALEAALEGRPRAAPRPLAAPPPAPPPAPDMADAPSLLSAVHLASYRKRENAEAGWTELRAAHASLAGLKARLHEVELAERGAFLRLKAGPFDSPGEASSACAPLVAAGAYCEPSDFSGRPLR